MAQDSLLIVVLYSAEYIWNIMLAAANHFLKLFLRS